MNFKAFLQLLLHAAVGGAMSGASVALAQGLNWKSVGAAAAGSAISSVISLRTQPKQ